MTFTWAWFRYGRPDQVRSGDLCVCLLKHDVFARFSFCFFRLCADSATNSSGKSFPSQVFRDNDNRLFAKMSTICYGLPTLIVASNLSAAVGFDANLSVSTITCNAGKSRVESFDVEALTIFMAQQWTVSPVFLQVVVVHHVMRKSKRNFVVCIFRLLTCIILIWIKIYKGLLPSISVCCTIHVYTFQRTLSLHRIGLSTCAGSSRTRSISASYFQ